METNDKQGRRLQNVISYVREHLFILSTAAAATPHTVWVAATLFAGVAPAADIGDPASVAAWLEWLLPGVALAFAYDAGLVAISTKLKHGETSVGMYSAFALLSVATYFSQWLFVVHHFPALTLSAGVRADWRETVELIRDSAIWILPLMLPLAITLYTFSHGKQKAGTGATIGIKPTVAIAISEPEQPALPEPQSAPVSAPQLPQPLNATDDYKALFTIIPDDWRKCKLCDKSIRRAGMKAHAEMHRKRGDLTVITEEQS